MSTRRFLPKVPVKKEKVEDEPVEEIAPIAPARTKHDRRGDSRTNNGGERKRYVAPSGDTFFTGNSTGLDKVKSSKSGPPQSSSSSSGGGGGGGGGGGKDGKSANNNNNNNNNSSSSSNNNNRGNNSNSASNNLTTSTQSSVPMEIDSTRSRNSLHESKEKFIDRHYDENYESSDIDDEYEGGRDSNVQVEQQSNIDNHETWPPVCYDTAAPVSLPLGPRSITKREADLLAPIVPSKDEEKLFLVQLPTDIAIRKTSKPKSDGAGSSDKSEAPETPGLAGKLLVRKSGKVEFVDKHGRHFDVSNGMTPYFMQLLVNIDTPKAIDMTGGQATESNEAQAAEALHTLASSSNGKSATSMSSNSHNNNTQGNFSVLSQIDRKLVFTPAYDIGINRNPNSKTNYGYNIPGLNVGQQVSIDTAILATKANLTNSRKDMARSELNRKINKKEVYEVVTKDIDLPLPARQRSDTSHSYNSIDDDDYEMNL